MNTLYLICFVLGVVLSLLAAFAGGARLHVGHFHFGHFHFGQPPAAHTAGTHGGGSVFNGFTLPAFLCWFGGAGYLLQNYSAVVTPIVLLIAAAAGLLGASLLYAVIARVLVPAERVLTADDTRMDGVVARVSDEIRPGGIGEILYSQIGSRRSAAARSESGLSLPRGTEVVVLRYDRGVATVSPLMPSPLTATSELTPTHHS